MVIAKNCQNAYETVMLLSIGMNIPKKASPFDLSVQGIPCVARVNEKRL